MANAMNTSKTSWRYEYEYYYDYLEPVAVNEHQLKYNKYSIVIIFWVILAAFVGTLFLILTVMSCSVNRPKSHSSRKLRRSGCTHSTCLV
ncbi:hypothetical protein UPYG_G00194050 [Umbra pygmaea]|uniref:Melanocortin-2 receptor accessory protein n=1 Tax=Umbra pygmaea TaxID=75934 RepID=A0ABD0WH14_UMBPY